MGEYKGILVLRASYIPNCRNNHSAFIISQLWIISHPRSTVVLLNTGTPGNSREINSEGADGESSSLIIGILTVETLLGVVAGNVMQSTVL